MEPDTAAAVIIPQPQGSLDIGQCSATASIRDNVQELESREPLLPETLKNRQVVDMAPIQTLPREIIEQIFKECVDELEWPSIDHETAPVLLTKISSDLRHIALTSPFLWSKFSFELRPLPSLRTRSKRSPKDRERNVKLQVNALEEWICRSGLRPLTFEVTFARMWPVQPLAEVLWKCSSRWKDVTLHLRYDILETEFYSVAADHFPLLSGLHISGHDGRHAITSSGMLKAPNLRKLSLRGWAEPHEYGVEWSRLTHLYMFVTAAREEDTVLQDLASILRQAISLVDPELMMDTYTPIDDVGDTLLPNLKSLWVRHRYPGQQDIPDKPPVVPFIRAPLLESLDTDSTFPAIKGFLERFPLLRKLTISYTPDENLQDNDMPPALVVIRTPLLAAASTTESTRGSWSPSTHMSGAIEGISIDGGLL